MDYDFRKIEREWQERWKVSGAYRVSNDSEKPKFYVLDMFPYPSGAGLHVGHPLGYIASDIYSRYKRLKGFNVLHPMGYDSFGLPAEQYALETGQHPAITTRNNIATFRSQLEKIGFSFDWDREIRTSDPDYYRWTQWIFLQIFHSWYNRLTGRAEYIFQLAETFEKEGNAAHPSPGDPARKFSGAEWAEYSFPEREAILMDYRLAYSSYGEVNWCEALGTVLANDEVVNGVSERGGYPVEKRKMRQWYLRITEYADRLLEGLEQVDFSDAMKEMQRNWIGRSEGAEMDFNIRGSERVLKVYTTRPDTIFGVDFMVVAPEHELVQQITTGEQAGAIDEYLSYVKSRSERERLSEVKQVTGCFTGAYAINPFNGREIPIWIAEYVLAGYGTGAIMAVPCGDQRDFLFAKHFNIPITNIIGEHFKGTEANPTKDAVLHNSGFLDGLLMRDAIPVALEKIEALGIGSRKVNFRMRDAGFSRQRYWGEPFPIVWAEGVALPMHWRKLPLELPYVDKYAPGPNGEGPLANLTDWVNVSPEPSADEEDAVMDGAQSDYAIAIGKGRREGFTAPSFEEWKRSLPYAIAKRNAPATAEEMLWDQLKDKKLSGFRFRRQHPVAGYMADFVCLQRMLVVEVDDADPENAKQKQTSYERSVWLFESEYNILRFTSEQVEHELERVLMIISLYLTRQMEAFHAAVWPGSFLERKGVHAKRETSTMPGYAGSSWYFLRYMDPHNDVCFCHRSASDYWRQVDVYVGGTEHAVGHLLYSRLWTKILFDHDLISFDEPFKKLVNQGMIQGSSRFVYRVAWNAAGADNPLLYQHLPQVFVSKRHAEAIASGESGAVEKVQAAVLETIQPFLPAGIDTLPPLQVNRLPVDVNIVDGYVLDVDEFRSWKNGEYRDALFVLEDGLYICGAEVEKMSKSKYNTVNPNELVDRYGADTFRMYEMFLGPVEQSKPWDTKGIEGVHRFLRKLWRLFYDEVSGPVWTGDLPSDAEWKILHRTIKKIDEDTERFSFNTAVSAFMICVNELAEARCHKKQVLESLLILLTPYAPHICAELWQQIGNTGSVLDAHYPVFDGKYLVESSKEYPLSINGKLRSTIHLALDLEQPAVEELVLQNKVVQQWLEGRQPKRIIYVKNKMVNVVV